VSHGFHLFFSTQRLIAAQCNRCFKLVAVYEVDTVCPGMPCHRRCLEARRPVPMRDARTAWGQQARGAGCTRTPCAPRSGGQNTDQGASDLRSPEPRLA
jgi:hypothetical protein